MKQRKDDSENLLKIDYNIKIGISSVFSSRNLDKYQTALILNDKGEFKVSTQNEQRFEVSLESVNRNSNECIEGDFSSCRYPQVLIQNAEDMSNTGYSYNDYSDSDTTFLMDFDRGPIAKSDTMHNLLGLKSIEFRDKISYVYLLPKSLSFGYNIADKSKKNLNTDKPSRCGKTPDEIDKDTHLFIKLSFDNKEYTYGSLCVNSRSGVLKLSSGLNCKRPKECISTEVLGLPNMDFQYLTETNAFDFKSRFNDNINRFLWEGYDFGRKKGDHRACNFFNRILFKHEWKDSDNKFDLKFNNVKDNKCRFNFDWSVKNGMEVVKVNSPITYSKQDVSIIYQHLPDSTQQKIEFLWNIPKFVTNGSIDYVIDQNSQDFNNTINIKELNFQNYTTNKIYTISGKEFKISSRNAFDSSIANKKSHYKLIVDFTCFDIDQDQILDDKDSSQDLVKELNISIPLYLEFNLNYIKRPYLERLAKSKQNLFLLPLFKIIDYRSAPHSCNETCLEEFSENHNPYNIEQSEQLLSKFEFTQNFDWSGDVKWKFSKMNETENNKGQFNLAMVVNKVMNHDIMNPIRYFKIGYQTLSKDESKKDKLPKVFGLLSMRISQTFIFSHESRIGEEGTNITDEHFTLMTFLPKIKWTHDVIDYERNLIDIDFTSNSDLTNITMKTSVTIEEKANKEYASSIINWSNKQNHDTDKSMDLVTTFTHGIKDEQQCEYSLSSKNLTLLDQVSISDAFDTRFIDFIEIIGNSNFSIKRTTYKKTRKRNTYESDNIYELFGIITDDKTNMIFEVGVENEKKRKDKMFTLETNYESTDSVLSGKIDRLSGIRQILDRHIGRKRKLSMGNLNESARMSLTAGKGNFEFLTSTNFDASSHSLSIGHIFRDKSECSSQFCVLGGLREKNSKEYFHEINAIIDDIDSALAIEKIIISVLSSFNNNITEKYQLRLEESETELQSNKPKSMTYMIYKLSDNTFQGYYRHGSNGIELDCLGTKYFMSTGYDNKILLNYNGQDLLNLSIDSNSWVFSFQQKLFPDQYKFLKELTISLDSGIYANYFIDEENFFEYLLGNYGYDYGFLIRSTIFKMEAVSLINVDYSNDAGIQLAIDLPLSKIPGHLISRIFGLDWIDWVIGLLGDRIDINFQMGLETWALFHIRMFPTVKTSKNYYPWLKNSAPISFHKINYDQVKIQSDSRYVDLVKGAYFLFKRDFL